MTCCLERGSRVEVAEVAYAPLEDNPVGKRKPARIQGDREVLGVNKVGSDPALLRCSYDCFLFPADGVVE